MKNQAATKKHHKKLSRTSAMHYVKLVYRSLLFLVVLGIYIVTRVQGREFQLENMAPAAKVTMAVVWVVLAVEVLLRFFPARIESMGCQKQFARNFQSTGVDIQDVPKHPVGPVLLAAFSWIFPNAILGLLYYLRIVDYGMLILVCLAYSVCDMICILFFCPFQTWILKNKCCTSCRIYNWDFAMMFTPLLFLPSVYNYSLVALGIALLIRWEVTYLVHPERFLESTNSCLSCKNCTEKLCHHKTQLQHFLVKNRSRLNLKDNLPVRALRKKLQKDSEKE